MKKILFSILFLSSFVHAQYSVKGTMIPALESDWVILYKLNGAKQTFITNTTIKFDSVSVSGEKSKIGTFEFILPENATPGYYRVNYRLDKVGDLDFIFNKENINFGFHPDYPSQSVSFSESEENILYLKYLKTIQSAQKELDTIQINAFKNPEKKFNRYYKAKLKEVNTIQKKFVEKAKNKYVQPFIIAAARVNASEVQTTPENYSKFRENTYFNNMDFTNKTLLNSSFLVESIADYVFYLNHSKDNNIKCINEKGTNKYYTIKKIKKGEEIVINYLDNYAINSLTFTDKCKY